jgi:mRNA interferase RelE/StbE
MPYGVKFASKADKQIDALQADFRDKVIAAIEKLSDNPRPAGCRKLKGWGAWRIRVGDYRVVYEIRDDVLVVLVVRIAHRREVYRG